MAWRYEQRSGLWVGHGLEVRGYSGLDDGDGVLEPGEGRNAPEREDQRGVGPVPRGWWQIAGPPYTHPELGGYVLRLVPAPDTDTHGRDAFRIHGDARKRPGTASHGCIILPRWAREAIWESGDRELEVLEGAPAAPPLVA